MTKVIPLTKGYCTIVDDDDYDSLSMHKWYCNRSKDGSLSACRRERGTRRFVQMHREITGVSDDKIIDHRDGDTLNNTRKNLRICTKSENNMNKKLSKNNTSGVRGVCWNNRFKRWNACIRIKNQYIWLGSFVDMQDAVEARQNAESELFGEFSYSSSRR